MILYGIFLGVTRMRWCHAQNQGGDGPLKRHAAAARNANSSRRNAYQCGHQTKRHAYIHMHAHTHTCTYTNAHAHTHAHTHTHAHANAHAHTHTHTHTRAHKHTHLLRTIIANSDVECILRAKTLQLYLTGTGPWKDARKIKKLHRATIAIVWARGNGLERDTSPFNKATSFPWQIAKTVQHEKIENK